MLPSIALFPIIKLTVCAAVGAILVPPAAPLIAATFGFGATGPIAGTAAAAWQASIGNVVAGSVFSTVQSVAMGGSIPAVVTSVGAVCGLVAAAV